MYNILTNRIRALVLQNTSTQALSSLKWFKLALGRDRPQENLGSTYGQGLWAWGGLAVQADCDTLYISLSLLSVSEAPKVAPVAKKFPSYNPHFKTEEEKKEEVSESQCLYQYL